MFNKFNDPIFQFWKGVSLIKQNMINEAINELNAIVNRKDIQFAAATAMIYAHSVSKSLDREQLEVLKNFEYQGRNSGNEKALSQGVFFYCLFDDLRKAGQLVELLGSS